MPEFVIFQLFWHQFVLTKLSNGSQKVKLRCSGDGMQGTKYPITGIGGLFVFQEGMGGVHLYRVCPLNWMNTVSVHTNLAAYIHLNSLNMYDLLLLAARPVYVCK